MALSPEAFSPPIFAALCSPDVNQAARRIEAYKPLVGPLRMAVDPADDATTLTFDWGPRAAPPPSLATTELLFWVALIRLGTRAPITPARVVTPDPPADQGPYVEFLGVEVQRGPVHSIAFRAGDAARPFLTANEEMWGFFEPELRRRLSQLDARATTADRVRAALVELLPAGRSSMREVASELATSTRTLQRRLGEEDTSFQAVLATTRESLARHYLTRSEMSAAEVSFLLGYADPSSFYRAFPRLDRRHTRPGAFGRRLSVRGRWPRPPW